MAEKIDPALAQLARENPLHGFRQGDYAIIWTSTCTTLPARVPVSGEKDTTARLQASAAVQFAQLADSTYCRKEKIGYLMDLYGKGRSTIEGWLSTFNSST